MQSYEYFLQEVSFACRERFGFGACSAGYCIIAIDVTRFYFLFLFSILTIKFLTTSISSGLLAVVKNVIRARASLPIMAVPSFLAIALFVSRNRRKQAAAILLLPSEKA
jgi:phosphoglycerol transferase MdoB-like AlkP superfamily enzyme